MGSGIKDISIKETGSSDFSELPVDRESPVLFSY